jgi:IS605 OrfB family transposase
MIRSSKLSFKFCNKQKLNQVEWFINEYKSVMQQCVDLIWEIEYLPSLAPKSITEKIKTWLSQRAIQCACKQAIAVVKGTKQKNKQRQFVIEDLLSRNLIKKAKVLQAKLTKISKPDLVNVCPELDSRFVKFDFDNKTSFDGWITLSSIGNKLKIKIPVKKTKHFNSILGNMKNGLRLSCRDAIIMFESTVELKQDGDTVGLDIGVKSIATLSDGQHTSKDSHGWDLTKIIQKMNSKTKGSKAYLRCQRHRTNYVNWSINQIDLSNVKKLKLERIKNVRSGVRTSRFLNRWTYTEIKSKLELTCEKLGVQVEYVSPTYTSQRCSFCGWVRSSNRKGKLFKCGKCGFTTDSDLNGARNICANLRPIGTKERLLCKNKTGFYWSEARQECIVPVTQTNIFQ